MWVPRGVGVSLSCGRWVTVAGGQGVPSRHEALGWATKPGLHHLHESS